MLDYKSIIIKRYALKMSYKELAEEFSASKSGINDFIRAFEKCEKLSYPLPEGITNYAIYELVYGHEPGTNNRSADYEQPDFAKVHQQMEERKNMTLVYLWGRYNALFEDGNVLSDEGLSDPLLKIIEEEIRKEEIEKLHSILAAFTEKQRFILFQCVVNGRMQIDVANEMGTTRMNVTISLRKSLDRLREYFDVSDGKFGTNHFYRPEE